MDYREPIAEAMEPVGNALTGALYIAIPLSLVVGFGFGASKLDKEMRRILLLAMALFVAAIYFYCWPVEWADFIAWCESCFVPSEEDSFRAKRRMVYGQAFIAGVFGYLLAKFAGWRAGRP